MSRSDTMVDAPHHSLSLGKILLFAITGGLAVGNLYWAQPLLVTIAATLDAPVQLMGGLITATQIGYALGILLIVPLGDSLNRKRLIPSVMLCSVVALLLCAFANSFISLAIAMALLGLTTVSGQLITPLASELAPPDQRGNIVGIIVSGMLTGILLSRSISGLVADVFGWRAIYFAAALTMLLLTIALYRAIPQQKPKPQVAYFSLLASVITTVRTYRAAQITLLIGALSFFAFSALWTGVTFLLSASPFEYSLSQIGMVGLVGLAGALVARKAGGLHDRGQSYQGLLIGLGLAIFALLMTFFRPDSIYVLLVAILVFDVGIQMLNVLNQTRLLTIAPQARNRLNTAFVSCNFVGGAIGSALAGLLWNNGGWKTLTLTCLSSLIVALILVTSSRKWLSTVTGHDK